MSLHAGLSGLTLSPSSILLERSDVAPEIRDRDPVMRQFIIDLVEKVQPCLASLNRSWT